MKKLGDKIKDARNKKGWTLDELAKRCRLSKAYLSQLESGHSDRPSAETLYNIAVALEVSIAELLGKKLKKVEEVDGSIPKSLEKAVIQNAWTDEIKDLLVAVERRVGKKSNNLSPDDWTYLYESIKRITGKKS